MQWILAKWKKEGKEIDFEEKDSQGNTPLMAVCVKGYLGSEAIAGKMFSTKQKRLEVVKTLVEPNPDDPTEGANINVTSDIVGMTPLHWAAFNDDPNVVAYLLKKGAQLKFSKRKSNGEGDVSPVDLAGVLNYEDVVYVFAKWLEAKITKEIIAESEQGQEKKKNFLGNLGSQIAGGFTNLLS